MFTLLLTSPEGLHKSRLPKAIFSEKNAGNKFSPEDIFEDPSMLLKQLGFKDFLNDEPIKHLKTGSTVWEYYLLRMLPIKEVTAEKYKYLRKQPTNTIKANRSIKLGNPYQTWKVKYGGITNDELLKEIKPFCLDLIKRRKALREKGNALFISKRKRAARAFFKYLLQNKINKADFTHIHNNDFYEQLIYLVRYQKSNQFIAAALMTCLYGGKNDGCIPGKLARYTSNALKNIRNSIEDKDTLNKVLTLLNKKALKVDFDPPLNSIYAPGKKSLVLTRFRVPVWIKLLKDTYEATH